MTKRSGNTQFLAGASAAVALSLTAMIVPANASGVQSFYSTGDYTYCDAKLLSNYWRQTPFDSKIRAGDKIARGEDYVVKDYLTSARKYALEHNVRCTFEDANNPDYSYDDASRLARYWGNQSPHEAKLKIAGLLQEGRNKYVRSSLQAAIQGRY